MTASTIFSCGSLQIMLPSVTTCMYIKSISYKSPTTTIWGSTKSFIALSTSASRSTRTNVISLEITITIIKTAKCALPCIKTQYGHHLTSPIHSFAIFMIILWLLFMIIFIHVNQDFDKKHVGFLLVSLQLYMYIVDSIFVWLSLLSGLHKQY